MAVHLLFHGFAHSILVLLLSSFFFIYFFRVHVVHPHSSIDITTIWKKFHFILLDRSNSKMIHSLSIAVHVFAKCILISLSEDEILLLRYMNLFTNFREPQWKVEMAPWLKHVYSVLFTFTWRPMPPATGSRLCSRDSAWVSVFTRSAISSANVCIIHTHLHRLRIP